MNPIHQLQPLPDQLASPKPGEGGSEPQLAPPNRGEAGSETSPDSAETRSATTNRRRVGMVARLPYAVRHKLNLLMRDGLSYPAIIQALGPDGAGLKPGHLSEWFKGGHQDWLRDQEWVELTRANQEAALDLQSRNNSTKATGIARIHTKTRVL